MRAGDRIGKYVLEAPLGSGGMAQVWAARAEGPQDFVKPVALKFILPGYSQDPTYGEMFFNEAKVAAGLHHANLVTVFDFDRVPPDAEKHLSGLYYIAMEKVEGRDLAAVIREAYERNDPLDEHLVIFIMTQILEGLRYLHERERFTRQSALVHRDLSPHNVLVSYAGEVKISDFGIAKLSSSQTTGDYIRGKLAYLAPEVLAGQRATPLTDQFAAGIVMWELLSGRRLFTGNNDAHTLDNVRRCVIPDPGQPGRPVSEALRVVITRMLAREPGNRFPTTAAAAAAVADLGPRAGAAVRLSELMLRLFPLDLEPATVPEIGRTLIQMNNASGPVPVLREDAKEIRVDGVALAHGAASNDPMDPDLPAQGSQAWTGDLRPGGTRILPGEGGPPGLSLPETRTIPHAGQLARIPTRPAQLPREPQFSVEHMPEHFARAESAMNAARTAGQFSGDFEAWMQWNAERGRDAISGRPLPAIWLQVARWPRFSDLGWRRPLNFNWHGTFPWGDDGYWIAEDATADEMMVLFAADLDQPAFKYVTATQWRSWWQEREVDIINEGPGTDHIPVSDQARAMMADQGSGEKPPHTRDEWLRLARAHQSQEAARIGSDRSAPRGQAMAGGNRAAGRPSFWQKLTRLSRGPGQGGPAT